MAKKKQVSMGLAFGSHEEGKQRRAHYERYMEEHGYKNLSEFVREIMDRATGFDPREIRRKKRFPRKK